MSDAAPSGHSGSVSNVVKQSVHHAVTTGTQSHSSTVGTSGGASDLETTRATANPSSGGSHITTEGSLVSSSDPTTNPDASLGQKLKGNTAGAIKGTLGSLQATTGAAIRNKDMENKGLEKMSEEDQRLGSKRGVMPVGSERREETVDANQAPK